MSSFQQVNREVVLARGKFAPTANETTIPVPGNGATVTIFDSTLNGNGLPPIPELPFARIQVNISASASSAANGIVFNSLFDGGNAQTPTSSNWRPQSTQTYTTGTPATFDYLMKGGHVQITYQNSASVLTTWEVEVVGLYDRNPGM